MELFLESLVIRRRPSRRGRRSGARLAAVVACGGFAGCANHNDRASGYLADLESGRWDAAVTSAERVASDDTVRNEIIDALELGTVQRIAGRHDASDATLGRAWDTMKRTADPGSPTFVDTLAAVAVNERALDYVGTSYDRVMCATLRALDALALGDPDSARVELKRAQFAQEDAEARFAEQIEAARVQMAQNHEDLTRIQNDSDFQSGFEAAYGDLEARFKPYAGWTNPFTDWLTAVLLHVDGGGSGDRNRAIDLLRRVRGTLGDNPAVDSDLAFIESGVRSPQTWVILESGFAPRREEVSFRIPAFIPEMPFIGIALPKLVQVGGAATGAQIRGGDATANTAIICDMGSVVAHEFQAQLPLITGRAIASAVAKAAASLAANLAAQQTENGWALLATMVATNVYGYATTIADLRTWRTLPRYYAVARIPAPADGRVIIDGDAGRHAIDVPADRDAMIVIRSVRAGGPAIAHSFKLTGEPATLASAHPSAPDSPSKGPFR
ncbi:MAG: hypothetical protein CMJ54_07395 [Planctomycetaceae bacterium]|nr:hypothetical protein [Planctomycetaceae bacterium]